MRIVDGRISPRTVGLWVPVLFFGLYNLAIICVIVCNEIKYDKFAVFVPFHVNEFYHFFSIIYLFVLIFPGKKKMSNRIVWTAIFLLMNAFLVLSRLVLSGMYQDGW